MAHTRQTHESYIQQVRRIALSYAAHVRDNPQLQLSGTPALADQQLEDIAHCKLIYGRGGSRSLRGITDCGRWNNGRSRDPNAPKPDDLVEVCALGQQDLTQIAATTIHELAHVATHSGHNRAWKEACAALGLRAVKMGCPRYYAAQFAPMVRESIARLNPPEDGAPNVTEEMLALLVRRGCIAGIGTRGGKTRGPGSGSRLRKYICPHGQIVRASTDELDASCNVCGGKFIRPEVQP
jgi:hypothetical protein